jgi:hypothetical protein
MSGPSSGLRLLPAAAHGKTLDATKPVGATDAL